MPVRNKVNCSKCGSQIERVTWNYGKNRPITTFFCDNDCKGAWQKAQREANGWTKEWLIDQYVRQGKSANDIAREVGRNPKRVWEWIRDYGIETRPRGSDERQLFKKGQPSAFTGMKHTPEARQRFRELRLKDGHVPYLKDGKHWLHATGAKPGNWKGGITPELQAFYSSEEWVEAVKAVWARDNATCQKCGKHHNTAKSRGTFHIHHVVSFKNKALRADVSNLALLCRACHLWGHSKKNINKEFIVEISA